LQSKRKNLDSQHESEKKALDEQMTIELKNLDVEYDERERLILTQQKNGEEGITQKLNQELQNINNISIDLRDFDVKRNKKYLELCIAEESLVKQQKYQEAHVIILRKKELEQSVKSKLEKIKNNKMNKEVDKLKQKHQTELDNIRKANELELTKTKTQKSMTSEKIVNKYRNKRVDLENQQKTRKIAK